MHADEIEEVERPGEEEVEEEEEAPFPGQYRRRRCGGSSIWTLPILVIAYFPDVAALNFVGEAISFVISFFLDIYEAEEVILRV